MSTHPSAFLSRRDIDAYRRDGVVRLRGVVDPGWIDLLAAGVETNLASPGPHARHYTPDDAPGHFFGDYCNWPRIEGYRRFAFESPAARMAGALMGSSKVNLFHEHVLVKEPGTAEPTPWHHDQPYWAVDGEQVCSMWVPLDSVGKDVGVEFVIGSHRWGTWYTPKRFVDGEDHPSDEGAPVPDVEARRDNYPIVSWAVEPGDCIFFHALTLHGAPGNPSKHRRRRAVSMRWTGDDARFARRDGLMSPPFEEVDLSPGSVMDCEHFPVVWQA